MREGSIKWETQLSLSSFSQKILKKIQYLAFTDKVKIIKGFVPEKVIDFIKGNFLEELKYFQKKYSIKIKLFSEEKLIIPEYKIELYNKSKKLIDKIESIKNIKFLSLKKNILSEKTKSQKSEKKVKKEVKKVKKKKLRTLWVRRKKKN